MYVAPNHNHSHLNQTTPKEKALGDSGEEKLPFNRKKPLAESSSHLPWPAGGEGRKTYTDLQCVGNLSVLMNKKVIICKP